MSDWWDKSWNVVTGCDAVSSGCDYCYARRIASGFIHQEKYRSGFRCTTHAEDLDKPSTWGTGKYVFLCSMGDILHKSVPDAFLVEVFRRMRQCRHHTFLMLTKRAERLKSLVELVGKWPQNVWPGVTVEEQSLVWRAGLLRYVPARRRFISCEPLLGPLSINLDGIDWVIAGGETGDPNKVRRSEGAWFEGLRDACQAQGAKFWFKQWGSHYPGVAPKLSGQTYEQRPGMIGEQQGLF